MKTQAHSSFSQFFLTLIVICSMTSLFCGGPNSMTREFLAEQQGQFVMGTDGKPYLSLPKKWAMNLPVGVPILSYQNENTPKGVYQVIGTRNPETGLLPIAPVCQVPGNDIPISQLEARFPSLVRPSVRSRCLGFVSERFFTQRPQAVIFNVGKQDGVLKNSKYQLLQDYSGFDQPQNQVFCKVVYLEEHQAHCQIEGANLQEGSTPTYALLKELGTLQVAKPEIPKSIEPIKAEENMIPKTPEPLRSSQLLLTTFHKDNEQAQQTKTLLEEQCSQKKAQACEELARFSTATWSISGFIPGEASLLYRQGAIFAAMTNGDTTDHRPQAYFQLAIEPNEQNSSVPIKELCRIQDPNIQVVLEENLPIEWRRVRQIFHSNNEDSGSGSSQSILFSQEGNLSFQSGRCLAQVIGEKRQKNTIFLKLDLGQKQEAYGKIGDQYKFIGGVSESKEASSLPEAPLSQTLQTPTCKITKIKTLLPKKPRKKSGSVVAPGEFDFHRIATCQIKETAKEKWQGSFERRYAVFMTSTKAQPKNRKNINMSQKKK